MRTAVITALICATVVACARVQRSESPGGRAPWSIAHTLRIAELSEPDRLNPYLSEMDVSYNLASLVYSYLIIADRRGRLVGDLAVSVPSLANGGISHDGRTYVYHLRHHVMWHDGRQFTADDVLASWRAVMNPRNDTVEREGYDRVSSIETPDAYTVVARLHERYPPFLSRFFAPLQEGGKPVLPAHILDRTRDFNNGEMASRPVGTGPFRFLYWSRGDRIVLQRFTGYFRGAAKLARIEVRFIQNTQTILTELQAHRIDLIASPQGALVAQYRSVPGVIVQTAPQNAQAALIINSTKPGLAENVVRTALAMAVPYRAILRGVEQGLNLPARNSLPPTALGYEPLAARTYDPAGSAALLERNGWHRERDGVRSRGGARLSFTLATIAGMTSFERIAVLIQSSLRRAGIAVTIKTYPYTTMFSAPSGPIFAGSFDLALYRTALNWDPDVYNFLGCDRQYPNGQNVLRFCDPQLDSLERAGLASDDTRRRAAVYRNASRRIWADVPYVPLFNVRRLIVRSADLRNYSVNPTSTPWWNAWQWDV